MARDPIELLMSRMLDSDLTVEEHDQFSQRVQQNDDFATAWDRMQLVDAMLSNQVEIGPSAGFTARVMARIETYEMQQKWYPWIAVLLSVVGVLMLIAFTLPWLIVTGVLQSLVSDLPVIGTVIVGIGQLIEYAIIGANIFANALTLWLQTLASEPMVLALVVSALAITSTYIGLREGQRVYALNLVETS